MSSLTKQEQLRSLIDARQVEVRRTFPANWADVVVALIRARDWHYLISQESLEADSQQMPASPSYLFPSGWQKALQICFSNAVNSTAPAVSENALDVWAEQVLVECEQLAEAEQVLAYCESGFMRMQQSGQKDFFAWIASKKMPTEWREREDIAWWTRALAQTHEQEAQELVRQRISISQQLEAYANEWPADGVVYRMTPEIDDYYDRLGWLRVKGMACHFLYPPETLLGGCTVEHYRTVLAALIGLALRHLDLCKAWVRQHPAYPLKALLSPPLAGKTLIAYLAGTLRIENATIQRAVEAFSLDAENVLYHCSIAEAPAPPLLRLNERQLVWSLAGLLSEPFFFLTRELKRRHSYEYNTAAHLHEESFRQDLYELFSDKRFVSSAVRVELRGTKGELTTDVDALIFDRKAGVLALFELKSQDPFAYSRSERVRQRDYFYNAGKQIVACSQWLNRNGANELLTRLDAKLVKRLKVQKTYIFVLGRYLAHFADGPEFDRRAAWGTWPQVLRLMGDVSFAQDANPLSLLYNRLSRDTPLAPPDPLPDVQQIAIGESIVYVFADFQAYKVGIHLT